MNLFQSAHRQSGVALLIVLATLALTVTTLTSLAGLAVSVRLRGEIDRDTDLAHRLQVQAEPPILHWLEHEAAGVVLLPDVPTPEVAVLRDRVMLGKQACEIQITAWDQCGMVPHPLVRGGSPLRLALPAEVRQTLDRQRPVRGEVLGLDQFLREAAPSPFPRPSPAPPAVGAYVATHSLGQGRLNVNTAPTTVLEAALRSLGRTGTLGVIQQARHDGLLVTLPSGAGPSTQPAMTPRLVAVSDTWAFRTDVQVGRVRRSWWSIYHRGPSNWSCVQRLAILD
jgi:hypothetical protein